MRTDLGGWCFEVLADLLTLKFYGVVLKAQLSGRSIPPLLLHPEYLHKSIQGGISNRLQAMLRSGAGSQYNNAKLAADQVSKSSATCVTLEHDISQLYLHRGRAEHVGRISGYTPTERIIQGLVLVDDSNIL